MLRYSGLLATFFATALSVQGGPAPYGSAKIYIVTSDRLSLSVEQIRSDPDLVMEVKEGAIVDWFASLHWEKHKHDTAIAERAKPLLIVIDLYHRVQPLPPAPPAFDTLFCSRKYAYSAQGDYIDISKLPSTVLGFPGLREKSP